jgi:hypothetical protein
MEHASLIELQTVLKLKVGVCRQETLNKGRVQLVQLQKKIVHES